MGTDKRARQKELSRSRAEAARKEAERAATKRRTLNMVSIVAVAAIIVIAIAVFVGGDDDADVATDGDTTSTTVASDDSTPSTDAAQTGATPTTAVPNIAKAGVGCPEADGSSPHYTGFSEAPEMCIDVDKTYTAEMQTNLGTFTIALDAKRAPNTVNNFVFLARYHYFDGLAFHRIIEDFMFQGGDPTGTGMDGPGYEFDDELPEQGDYQLYSVAMANSGPNTDGSQFFVITGENGVALPPSYSLFGQVTEGTDVADAIGAVETDSGDLPLEAVVMEKVTITES